MGVEEKTSAYIGLLLIIDGSNYLFIHLFFPPSPWSVTLTENEVNLEEREMMPGPALV